MTLLTTAAARGVGLAMATVDSKSPGGVSGWLLHFHGTAAYAIVGFLCFAEAALMVGFFIPGETAVVVGGVLAGLHQVNLETMMAVVVVCAIVGDSVGFEVGKRAGPWFVERRPLKGRSGVRRTMAMLERYGGPAVFLGRFVAFARAIIPGLAGMSGLRYRVFLFYNALGGLIWGVGYTLLGFIVGVSFAHILSTIGLWSVSAVAGIVVVVFVVVRILKRRERRRSGASGSGGGPEESGSSESEPRREPAVPGDDHPIADRGPP